MPCSYIFVWKKDNAIASLVVGGIITDLIFVAQILVWIN